MLVPQLAVARGVDEQELAVRAWSVDLRGFAEGGGASVIGYGELDGLWDLRGVCCGGGVTALEESEERGLAAAGRTYEQDRWEGCVRCAAGDV